MSLFSTHRLDEEGGVSGIADAPVVEVRLELEILERRKGRSVLVWKKTEGKTETKGKEDISRKKTERIKENEEKCADQ